MSENHGHRFVNGRCDACGKDEKSLRLQGYPTCAAIDMPTGVADAAVYEKPDEPHEPKGTKFYDSTSGREMLLVEEGHAKGWICFKHPDGQWVTLREATEDDLARIEKAKEEQ